MNTVKKAITRIKQTGRKILNAFVATETIGESKNKWNTLASKNAAYYVMTDYGEGITEEQFRSTGEKDYRELINNDSLLNERLSPFSEKTVLEIGCGIGRISEFLAQNFKYITGIDISEEMINQAQKRLGSVRNISFRATDGSHFPFPDESFDFVFSFIVFQHMPDKETVIKNLQEVSRILKKGGIAKIQLRGLPTSKKNWFYGPALSLKEVQNSIKHFPIHIIKSENEGQRYFWIWFEKATS